MTRRALGVLLASTAGCHLLVGLHKRELDEPANGAGGASASGSASSTGAGANAPVVPKAIAVGGNHSCALTSAGTVYCWGENVYGQLGLGDGPAAMDSSKATPQPVPGLGNVLALAAGRNHTCALTANDVRCWGWNGNQQLGTSGGAMCKGSFCSRSPVVAALKGIKMGAIAAGALHTCAVTLAGNQVWCWGSSDSLQTGVKSPVDPSPRPIDNAMAVDELAAGFHHNCVRVGTGVWCWGGNDWLQLAQASMASQSDPQPVGKAAPVASLGLGAYHSCAIDDQGGVICWGANDGYQFGTGVTADSAVPTANLLKTGMVQVAGGDVHTCARGKDGGVWCWGGNDHGQAAADTSVPAVKVPTPVSTTIGFAVAIGAGIAHTCALAKSNTVYCWGANDKGQLGSGGSPSDSSTPSAVKFP